MELPYSLDAYFALMAAYNAEWLTMVLLAGLLAIATAALALFLPDRAANWRSRAIAGYLAAAWVWIGIVHQLGMMADLNFLAPVYGIAWIGQGILLAWTGLILGKLKFGFQPGLSGALAKTLIVFGLVIYPAILFTLDHDWKSLPLAGTAPSPTVIFTAGLLLTTRNGTPLSLFIVPLAWAAVSGLSAYLLDHAIDYTVSVAVVVALSLALYERFSKRMS